MNRYEHGSPIPEIIVEKGPSGAIRRSMAETVLLATIDLGLSSEPLRVPEHSKTELIAPALGREATQSAFSQELHHAPEPNPDEALRYALHADVARNEVFGLAA